MVENAQQSNGFRLFGWELNKTKRQQEQEKNLISPVPPTNKDGEGYISAGAGFFGQSIDLDPQEAKQITDLIGQYRQASMQPEVDDAIENIVNEAVTCQRETNAVKLSFIDEGKMKDEIKEKAKVEFDNIVAMLNFNEIGHDIFRSWYIDGRMFHHLVIEKGKERNGIVEIRQFDSIKIRKVREIVYAKHETTGVSVVKDVREYFVFQDRPKTRYGVTTLAEKNIFTKDCVSYVTSGLTNPGKTHPVSYLQMGLKVINQLRMMEDSLVIYRLARAPERRIFYVDTGLMQAQAAEKYVNDLMNKYRNKIVYDTETGGIRDNKKHQSILEDFWLPRKEGGRGTEISTLPGGENLGKIDDIKYFEEKMYKALKVPVSRLDADNSSPSLFGQNGDSISRDEIKFQKFIERLRLRFSHLFIDILHKQLLLKNIMTPDELEELKDEFIVEFTKDNYYAEVKQTEIWQQRLGTLNDASQHIGVSLSREWMWKTLLHLDEDEIKLMRAQIESDRADLPDPEEGKPKT